MFATLRHSITGRSLLATASAVLLSACGASQSETLDFSEKLIVAAIGTFKAPDSATGNAEPKSITLTLNDVSVTTVDGTTSLADLQEFESTEYSIGSRSEIIFEGDLAELVDTEITAITLDFDSAIVGSGKIEDELASTLDTPQFVHTESFTPSTAQTMRMDLEIQWKNIVTRDEESDPQTETMSSPSFEATLEQQ